MQTAFASIGSTMSSVQTDWPKSMSPLRTVFFLLNFGASVLFLIGCVIGVATMQNPFEFLGGILLFVPIAIYALAEWAAFYRRNVLVERKLGRVNLGCAAFALFGVVTNVGEALMEETDVKAEFDIAFLAWFVAIGLAIVAYLVLCGMMRLRWTREVLPDVAKDR